MKQLMMLAVAVTAFAFSACARSSGDGHTVVQDQGGATSVSAQEKNQSMTGLKPPSPDSVLYFVYQRDGDGARRFQVDGGDTVSYWFGHDFQLGGQHYFTGFTSRSAGSDGAEAEALTTEPGAVAIGQVTLVQVEEGGQPGWKQVATDGYVGELGSLDQADPVDTSRQAQSHEMADGQLLLAVPTHRFEGGVDNASYAMFRFNASGLDGQANRTWKYVGTIRAGSDNSASCEDGGVMTCAVSTGHLSFEDDPQSEMPRLRVALTGETISGPGQTRALGPKDALLLDFDANAGQYEP